MTAENDPRWGRPCSLMGCHGPTHYKHHHHYRNGHLNVVPCHCEYRDQPGTELDGPREARS